MEQEQKEKENEIQNQENDQNHGSESGSFIKGLFCGVLLVLICMAGMLFCARWKITKLQSGTISSETSEKLDLNLGQVKHKTGEIEALINAYYLDEIDGQQVEDTMYTGMVAGLDDPYSVYYSKEELETVCGLGTVTGLCGANCYHVYYPFIPGVSERLYTDEWLEEQNRKELETKEWNGKEYNLYEQTQKQRQMETAMRAQREKIDALKAAKVSSDEITLAKAKYQAQLNEYSRFCRQMGLKEQRERIYYDMRGRLATNSKKQNAMFPSEMLKNSSRDVKQYQSYKEVLRDSIGSLAKFGQMKYNDSEEWEKLQRRFSTYQEINKKDWSEEFKNKSKQAYDKFAKEDIIMSVHALSRLPRLNKPELPEVSDAMLMEIIKGKSNYTEGEEKQIYFVHDLQLLVVRNKKTGDIVSVVRRKEAKGEWKSV